MRTRTVFAATLGAIGLLLLGPVDRSARAGYLSHYDVTLEAGLGEVTRIVIAEQHESGGSLTWAFSAPEGSSRITNPFPTDHDHPLRSILIGLAENVATDTVPEKHIVLFMDNTAAALAENIAWGTLFRTTLEEQLIADLELMTSGQDWETIDPGLQGVDTFLNGEAKTGILGPGGFEQSAWFNLGDGFTVMAFSDGRIVGSGQSSRQFIPAAVPEPASLAMAGLGLLGVAALARRGRRAA
jgi:hypothetical protein